MQAIQPPVTPLRPVKNSPRVTPRRSSRQRSYPHQTLAAETGVKLAVNMVLSVCATSALLQLWPHYRAVQEKLHEIQAEVNLTQGRVDRSRSDFNRYFDPSLAKTVMQEQSNQADPQQRPVILQEVPEAEESTPQP
ncbi:slr1601 family putative cell division protein [Microcoleus sp. B4-C1]|uniref:slr1601 family putative cell division protein n=1 Tax=Microcoleus sp. B4-C1 TaxID=2818660 RepID=UPI002FD27E35